MYVCMYVRMSVMTQGPWTDFYGIWDWGG